AEFATAFTDADTLHLLDIYAASEEPIPGIDAPTLAAAIRQANPGSGPSQVDYAPTVPHAVQALAREARPGDAIVTLGAGSVSHAAPLILEALTPKPA
ncbi:MAG TPA: UDP-N-acetylmuramate--L-alanine ligase, partial [Granulicella sp.]|nr:UDP-N-acetylmuramate--L-alanine ligase [Granulicella sp.]